MRLRCLFLAIPLVMPLAAVAECTREKAPTVPDGSTVAEEELVKVQQAVKSFMASGNAYLECLDKEAAAAGPEEDKEKQAARTEAYNVAVDEMHAVATSYNAAAKAFKAAHP